MRFTVAISGRNHELEVAQQAEGFECRIDGRLIEVDVARIAPDSLSILYDGKSYMVRREGNGGLLVGESRYEVTVTDPRSWRARQQALAGSAGPQKLLASMPGKVVRIMAAAGSEVRAGQGIVVIEAMKMQNEVRAPRDGTVTSIQVREGQSVNTGEVVAIID